MDLEQTSIERFKMASKMSLQHYGQPLVITYSGGKDSDVMLELCIRSGIPFEVCNSHTTADASEKYRVGFYVGAYLYKEYLVMGGSVPDAPAEPQSAALLKS